MAEEKKPSIFKKALELSDAFLDSQIHKARTLVASKYDEANFDFGKAVTRDQNHFIGSQGFHEKAGVLSFELQKQIAIKSSIVAAIIKTFQNKVAAHSEYVPQGNRPGFKIVLKHEQDALEEIMEELFGSGEEAKDEVSPKVEKGEKLSKADKPLDASVQGELESIPSNDIEEEPMTDEEKLREARKELEKRTRKKKREIAEFILNCGEKEDRPFETQKWNFNTFLKAFTWDSLVYDLAAVELIPKEAEKLDGKLNIHHFQPVDGSTVRYASPDLKQFKDGHLAVAHDILYPEEEIRALEERDALELDEDRLEANEYKYVQVVKGRIERAFTGDELKVGMRNPTTNIYANGYSISELELLISLVTSHMQTENFNKLFFQQGFGSKGILHVKANLNRGKLEELRRHWHHMVKGSRNSFQTPIMAGMDSVEWIPLTQSHSEMEFNLWLHYLIRMISAIYQIDPAEVGFSMKSIGGGGGISGDDTKEKLEASRNKGFIPLMRFISEFLNQNLIKYLDEDYRLVWTGLEDEADSMARVARLKEESQWLKTVNEVRAEEGLPAIKGADFFLNPVFMQWFSTMSEAGQKFMQTQQDMAIDLAGPEVLGMGGENNEGDQKSVETMTKSLIKRTKRLTKSRPLKIEYYTLKND